jgi:hypothetical protein
MDSALSVGKVRDKRTFPEMFPDFVRGCRVMWAWLNYEPGMFAISFDDVISQKTEHLFGVIKLIFLMLCNYSYSVQVKSPNFPTITAGNLQT